MAFYELPLKQVHIEMTDRCNAACPMCARNQMGGVDAPGLPDTQITLEQAKEIFEPGLLAELKRVVFCGDYGDPVVARDTLEVVRFLREAKPSLSMSIFTNGSLRGAHWWSELATLLPDRKLGKVVFAIDGLADTNHLYRRRTSFEKIMENAAAFIGAGGAAAWDFIVFRHNEHQIEEARALSARMGFFEFRVKRTHRFHHTDGAHWPVKDMDGNIEYHLEMPLNAAYQNPVATPAHPAALRQIECKSATAREVYVTSEGLVLPCCYLGYIHSDRKDGVAALNSLIEAAGGRDAISALRKPISEIIKGPLFESVRRGWAQDPLAICKFTCGRVVDPVENQLAARHEAKQ